MRKACLLAAAATVSTTIVTFKSLEYARMREVRTGKEIFSNRHRLLIDKWKVLKVQYGLMDKEGLDGVLYTGHDHKKIYKGNKMYKTLPEDRTCHNFTYKLGLNTDHIKFDPKGSCAPGGLYFTTRENLHSWAPLLRNIICDVKIPNDALVYNTIDKFKADKIKIRPQRTYKIVIWDGFLNWSQGKVSLESFTVKSNIFN